MSAFIIGGRRPRSQVGYWTDDIANELCWWVAYSDYRVENNLHIRRRVHVHLRMWPRPCIQGCILLFDWDRLSNMQQWVLKLPARKTCRIILSLYRGSISDLWRRWREWERDSSDAVVRHIRRNRINWPHVSFRSDSRSLRRRPLLPTDSSWNALELKSIKSTVSSSFASSIRWTP